MCIEKYDIYSHVLSLCITCSRGDGSEAILHIDDAFCESIGTLGSDISKSRVFTGKCLRQRSAQILIAFSCQDPHTISQSRVAKVIH